MPTAQEIAEYQEQTGTSASTAAYNLGRAEAKEATRATIAAAKEAGGSGLQAAREVNRIAAESGAKQGTPEYNEALRQAAQSETQAWQESAALKVKTLQDMADKYFGGNVEQAAETLEKYNEGKRSSTEPTTTPGFENLTIQERTDLDRYGQGLSGGVFRQMAQARLRGQGKKAQADEQLTPADELKPGEETIEEPRGKYYIRGKIKGEDITLIMPGSKEGELIPVTPEAYEDYKNWVSNSRQRDAARQYLLDNGLATDEAGVFSTNLAADIESGVPIKLLKNAGYDTESVAKATYAVKELKDYKEDDDYSAAKYLRDNPEKEQVLRDIGMTDESIAELKDFNLKYLGIGSPEHIERKEFIKQYFKDNKWEYVTRGTIKNTEDLRRIDEANAAYDKKYSPPMTLDQYQANYFQDKGWEVIRGSDVEELTADEQGRRLAIYYKRQDEVTRKYAEKYGSETVISQGIEKAADLVVPGAYVAKNWNTLSVAEKSVNIAIDVIFLGTIFGGGAVKITRSAYNLAKRGVGDTGVKVIDGIASRLNAGIKAGEATKVATEARNMIRTGEAMKTASVPGGDALIERGQSILANPQAYIRVRAVKTSNTFKEAVSNLIDEAVTLSRQEAGFYEIAERQGRPLEPLKEGPRPGERVKVGEYPITREEARLSGLTDDELDEIIRRVGTDREKVLQAIKEKQAQKAMWDKLLEDIQKSRAKSEQAKIAKEEREKIFNELEKAHEKNRELFEKQSRERKAKEEAAQKARQPQRSVAPIRKLDEYVDVGVANEEIRRELQKIKERQKEEAATKAKEEAEQAPAPATKTKTKTATKTAEETATEEAVETETQPAPAPMKSPKEVTEEITDTTPEEEPEEKAVPSQEIKQPGPTKEPTTPPTEEKPPRTPKTPPSKVPPKPPPEEPPGEPDKPPKRPPIKLPAGASDEEKRKLIRKTLGAVTQNMGKLHGKDVWHTWLPDGQHIVVLGKKPQGATDYDGKGSAYKTTQALGRLAQTIRHQHGAVMTTIKPAANRRGARATFTPTEKRGRLRITKINKGQVISRVRR